MGKPCYLWMVVKVVTPRSAFSDTGKEGERASLCLGGYSGLTNASQLGFLCYRPEGSRGGMGTLPTAGQDGSLGLALWPWLTEMDVGSYFFPWGSAVIRPFVIYKFFVLLSCPYRGPLAREEGLFLGLLFPGCWPFQYPVWDVWG